MPWKAKDTMSLRREFVGLGTVEGPNIQKLCQGFGISRKTGYKWLTRSKEEGEKGLEDRSRRPLRSPWRTGPEIVKPILAVRNVHAGRLN